MYKLLPSFFAVIFLSGVANPVLADNLGRLFTDNEERLKLDKIRIQKPVKPVIEEVAPVDIIEETEVVEDVIRIEESLRLKGLVYRSDGKNTAWINDSNSFEGDLESQYIDVNDNGISQEEVEIVMPDKQTKIKLKVGDAYIPEPVSE